ncbi:MAG: SPOR domain-containing protein [Bacteroidales bacterium]|nr:SPOR domain-containing protein [Bacteroidales bacterium]
MRKFGINCILICLLAFILAPVLIAREPEKEESLLGIDLRKAKIRFQRAVDSGQDSLSINLAEVLFYSGDYEEALMYYQKADTLNLIKTLQQKRNFTHAARLLNIKSGYESSTGYFHRDWDFDVDIADFAANSTREDFAPYKWNNILFITSSRESTRRRYAFTNQPYLNVYAFDENYTSISLPDYLPRRLNTRLHDGPITISADTNLVVITRNYPKPNQRNTHNLYLEYYVRENGKWSDGRVFPFSDERYSLQHPYFDEREKMLYFSSDMPGGFGGFDLYKSKWNGQEWESLENLGPEINSPYDEVFPSLSPYGDLIYSTNHIETYGGLDIVLYRDGMRTLFPPPINSPRDDFAISFAGDSLGYFSSNRSRGVFRDNIHTFSIPEPLPVEYNYFATVKDMETLSPIEDALVAFASDSLGVFGIVITDENGRSLLFRSSSDPGVFNFEVSKSGYNNLSISSDEFIFEDTFYNITLLLGEEFIPELITSGTIILYFENDVPPVSRGGFSNVADYQAAYDIYLRNRNQYYQNSINTREELDAFFEKVDSSKVQLELLLSFMKEQLRAGYDFSIELTAHASPLATTRYNEILSRRRNASVKNYFRGQKDHDFEKYINDERIVFTEIAVGDTKAPANVSDSRTERQRSVYSVEASLERRVQLEWEMIPTERVIVADKYREDLETTKIIDAEVAPAPEVELHPTHFIIVGSLRTMSSARVLLRELEEKGVMSAGILESATDGNFRVYHSAYHSRSQALNEIGQIRRDITPDAWIFTKEVGTEKLEAIDIRRPPVDATAGDRFFIIVGAFRNFSGAEATVTRLKSQGEDRAGILEETPGGLYHVYSQSFPTLREAQDAINRVKRDISGEAWIFRKR